MKKSFLYFFLLSLLFLKNGESFYYFVPPSDWKVVPSDKLPSSVKIGFVANSQKTFKPSLNLAIETTSAPLEDYVKAVKKKLLASRKNRWNELGYVETLSGKAHISQIDTKAECGDIRTMQCILKKEGNFYILTAMALRDEFVNYHDVFLKAFETLCVADSAISTLKDGLQKKIYQKEVEKVLLSWKAFLSKEKKGKSLAKAFLNKSFQKKNWKEFEKTLSKVFKDQGTFWQIMAASEIKDSLILESDLTKFTEELSSVNAD